MRPSKRNSFDNQHHCQATQNKLDQLAIDTCEQQAYQRLHEAGETGSSPLHQKISKPFNFPMYMISAGKSFERRECTLQCFVANVDGIYYNTNTVYL